MISSIKITDPRLWDYSIDDFCKEFIPLLEKHLIGKGKRRKRKSNLSLSEVMPIQVLFHLSGFRNFKTFYLGYVCKHLRGYFPDLVSYNRMVELCSDSLLPLAAYLKNFALGDCTGISYIQANLFPQGLSGAVLHRTVTYRASKNSCGCFDQGL